MPKEHLVTMRVLTLAVIAGAGLVLAPFVAPLVLAAWLGDVMEPLVRRRQLRLHGRRRASAAIIVLLALILLAPLVGAAMALLAGTRDFIAQVRLALAGQGTLAGVFLGNDVPSSSFSIPDWASVASRYGANAWRALSTVARASATALLNLFVFVFALYMLSAHGRHTYLWFARHLPIPRAAFTRLARAFRETGRGLIVGAGGTALAQGVVATVAYVALGIPRALVLGPLTAICAVIPVIGTGLVWILLGPLLVRLAVEVLYIARTDKLFESQDQKGPESAPPNADSTPCGTHSRDNL